ncbi:subtilisin-like protein [Hortaea werneckii]|nr:subtilisin-like protein [Hortaea werneckii]KAI6993225.1 subtilisin-like protein [Hortaea werneckii]KAI7144652.1 subtilisin-like protein [Hortaea werneckii]KAI7173022.1 subtilisin-like protein [Hortaea werneckii]
MYSFRSLALLAASSLIANVTLTAAKIQGEVAPKVPGAYIVELQDDQNQDTFYNGLGNAGQAIKHRQNLKYSLFNGVSFQLLNTTDEDAAAKSIEIMPEVRQIWPVRIFSVPKDEVVWSGNSPLEVANAGLQRRQEAGNDTFSPHVMTQVDQLRAQGITGEGVRIAVIDTGTDYKHPALGGCFGEGCLVSFGTDLVGDNYDGTNEAVPDPDPYDDCEGHGTHVAGIIAAQMNPFGFTGAAPDVTLGSYRVFGCGGSAGNDVLIAAYNQAYEDGADIITASIGGPSGWSEDPWAVAVQRIVEQGVPCTVSAGNDGAEGIFYASTAANGKKVTAVASVDNTQSPAVLLNATYSVNNGTGNSFGWTEGNPSAWGNVSLPLYAGNYNTSDPADACEPYPDSTPDLSDYIVLIRRGTCTFVQKVTNAADKGARYIMFYNNVAGASAVTADVEGIEGVGMTTADQGVEWVRLLANGSEVVLNIVDPDFADTFATSSTNTRTGGFLSTFTSWGPTYELDIKPQISSPGGMILSTYPLALGGYAVLSGTSMACPLAAAVVGLVGQVRGTFDPATIESLLAATANPNLFNDGTSTYPILAPVAQQGGGLIQAYDAAYTNVELSVSSIAFNDTDNFEDTMNFTISNAGDDSVTYSLSNVGAATAYTFSQGSIYPDIFPNELVDSFASVEFSSKEVSIGAGSESTVQIMVTPPQGLDASRLAVWSGYIAMNGSDGTSLSLPYQGVTGSMHDQTVLDTENTYLTTSASEDYAPVTSSNSTFYLPRSNSTASNSTAYPEVAIALAFGSSLVRCDVHPVGPQGYGSNSTNILGVASLGNIYSFPYTYAPRGGLVAAWDGMLEDGTMAPAGTYQLVVRALHIFGDKSMASEYDSATTVPFTIKYV